MYTVGNFNPVWDRIVDDLDEVSFTLRKETLSLKDLEDISRSLELHTRTIDQLLGLIQMAQRYSLEKETDG